MAFPLFDSPCWLEFSDSALLAFLKAVLSGCSSNHLSLPHLTGTGIHSRAGSVTDVAEASTLGSVCPLTHLHLVLVFSRSSCLSSILCTSSFVSFHVGLIDCSLKFPKV